MKKLLEKIRNAARKYGLITAFAAVSVSLLSWSFAWRALADDATAVLAPTVATGTTTPAPATIDVGFILSLINAIKHGDAGAIMAGLIALLTWVMSGKVPKIKDWLDTADKNPQFEWLKPTIVIILGALTVACPAVMSGTIWYTALYHGLLASGLSGFLWKYAWTIINSFTAKHTINLNLDDEFSRIAKIGDDAQKQNEWAALSTKVLDALKAAKK
jgi:hypothetical protein